VDAEHVCVLPDELLQHLRPRPGARFVDGTLGGGGHARLLLERIVPGGILLGIDRDPEAVQRVSLELSSYGRMLRLRCADFADLKTAMSDEGLPPVDGIVVDLGLSSLQLADPTRGFSFLQEGPLDMRYDRSRGAPASELLERLSEKEIADLLWCYAEERASRRLARRIVERRRESPLRTTRDLAHLAEGVVPRRRRGRRAAHPATRAFQALRIAVNRELESLERFLADAPQELAPEGRLAVISFHSLEDRLVKNRFRDLERCGDFVRVTRKVVRAGAAEVEHNPRARSARLRVLERVA
jgi:16S rRNA (cytosine1402-N4)-methyltransferase